ncbi:histidine phosphatase family protein [Demequina aurantiaca]|uniref:histidine phosphatase family protein n=1 Tax=Demequina aurantiaca TaxID=676200 RepID=UPI003D33291D
MSARTSPSAVSDTESVSPLTLVLVRHGVTEMTVAQRFSGSGTLGPHLNPAGRIQAAKAADAIQRIGRDRWEALPKVTRVIASPMNRTQDTGAALGRRTGLNVETDPRLREVHFGSWEGLTGPEIIAADGDAISDWRSGQVAAPGGESMPDVGRRMESLLVDLAAEHAAKCVDGDEVGRSYAFATHSVAIKSCIGLSMGIDERKWNYIWPSPASLTILQLRVNRTGEIGERHLMCLGAATH